jgi:hypothetical protein
MKRTHVAFLSLLISPLAMAADKPSTQPVRPRDVAGVGGRILKHDGMLPGQKPTQEEIDAAMAFVKENAPNHYDLFNRLPENSPRRDRAQQLMVMRYRNLMRMKDNNADAYQAMLDQWKLEDEAIDDARAIKEGKPDSDVRLREVCRQMVQKSLDDRRARIEKLRSALDDQQKQLDKDEQNKETVIAQLVNETQKKFERLFDIPDHDHGAAPQPNDVNALQK